MEESIPPPNSARALIIVAVVIFLAMGMTVAVLSWNGGEPRHHLETVPAALALAGVVALPGIVSLIALWKGAPRLLWPAIVAGLLPAIVTIFSVGLALMIPLLLLVQASLRWPAPRTGRSWRHNLVGLSIPPLAMAASVAFFAHRDPARWIYSTDAGGGVVYTRIGLHGGMKSGWFVDGGRIESFSTGSAEEGGGSICVSDRVTAVEGLVALAMLASAIAVAVRIARGGEAGPQVAEA